MADTQPPATANTTDQPGRPYYESLRATLRGTLAKKRALDEQLAALEDSIYKLEGAYLEDTAGAGNIVRGFDNWVKGAVLDKRADDRKGRGRIREEERIFSRSSVGWMRSQESPAPSSTTNTPSHAPTPTSSVPPNLTRGDSGATPASGTGKNTNKKKKAADRDEDEDGKPAKRGKVSYGRD